MSNDIKATVVKGKQVYITNGFRSPGYTDDNIVAMTVADPMVKQPGRILNPICKALEYEGVACYINKQQAGPAGAVFIDKSSISATTFKRLFNTDISEWL